MRILAKTMLFLAGVIHLLPLPGVLGGARLEALYGIRIDDPNLELLMRHRAVLFFLLGAFMIVAAFRPALERPGFVAGLASVASFLWLAAGAGGLNPQVGTVFTVDLIALACLLVGCGAHWRNRGLPAG